MAVVVVLAGFQAELNCPMSTSSSSNMDTTSVTSAFNSPGKIYRIASLTCLASPVPGRALQEEHATWKDY
jgi:FlaG/FlaF family flagellin (archaellin)